MKVMDFLNDRAITCSLKSTTKHDVIAELTQVLVGAGAVEAAEAPRLIEVLLSREALGSTGIGQGVAIPHGKSNCVKDLVGAFGVSRTGLDFGSLDGEPTYLFFLLVAPENSAGPHLKALARISRLLKDKFFRESLRHAQDETTLLSIIREEDAKRH